MCGIVGMATAFAGVEPESRNWVERSVGRMTHRGPDASGVIERFGCILGHTRLRVIDTDQSADQPMELPDGSLSVVFNGEIYNYGEWRRRLQAAGHRFRTHSDTEVLLHLYQEYGPDMVDRLEGMFAFALWDTRARRMLLARDRLGIKPLYYRLNHARLSFASMARLLVDGSSDLRPAAVAAYLRLGWIPGPETVYPGVYELPPGRRLVWDERGSALTRYWPVPAPAVGSDDRPVGEAELTSALRASVARQLVADVPVGLFLSSGVDSVVLAALAAQEKPDVQAYTVGFDTGPDETKEASAIAQELGIRHTIVPIDGDSVMSSVNDIIAAMDQPTVDGCNTWVVSRAVRRAGPVVALSGLGGDELFRGYSTFRLTERIASATPVANALPDTVSNWSLRTLASIPRVAHSRGLRAAEGGLRGGPRAAYASVRSLFSAQELRRLWPDVDALLEPVAGPVADGADLPARSRVMQMELANYLPFQLLRDTDAMSMAHALEVRVPLLDEQVVDVVLRRERTEQSPFDKTSLLRAAGPRWVSLAARPKKTFTLPFASWLRGPLFDLARESVLDLADADLGLERRALTQMWKDFEAGRLGWRPLWSLVVLARWRGTYRTSEVAA